MIAKEFVFKDAYGKRDIVISFDEPKKLSYFLIKTFSQSESGFVSEIRYSKLDNRYVVIAPERFHKPNEAFKLNLQDDNCPFCKHNEHLLAHEIFSLKDNNGDIEVRVIPNLFTAVNLDTRFEVQREGFFEKMSGFGVHEIIIDTPVHKKMDAFTSKEYFFLLKTIKARVSDLKKDSRIKYLSIFKNSGVKAGASQSHPHTQIIGLPVVPISKKEQFMTLLKHYKQYGRSLLREIADEELAQDKRILLKNQYFTSFMPYASLYSFEVMIVPNSDFSSITCLDDDRLESLGSILQKSMENKSFDSEDFFDDIEMIHLFALRIYPRIFHLAGFELSQDMHINAVEPEFAVKILNRSV